MTEIAQSGPTEASETPTTQTETSHDVAVIVGVDATGMALALVGLDGIGHTNSLVDVLHPDHEVVKTGHCHAKSPPFGWPACYQSCKRWRPGYGRG